MKKCMNNYKNWIFDWSGTLVDDLTMVVDATNYVLKIYDKLTFTKQGFREAFTLPYLDFYEEMLPGVPLEEVEQHFRKGFAHAEASGVVSPLLPHAQDFLEFLKMRGVRMFILSSMDAAAFEKHAVDLGVDHYFEASYAGILDKRDQIHGILEKYNLAADETVFVGDMTHDVETAKHGGIASIALLTGYQSEEQLRAVEPDHLVADLAEVKKVLIG